MKRSRPFRIENWLAILMMVSGAALTTAQAHVVRHSPDEVLLVYNGDSAISTVIGKDYAARRGVKNVVVIHCADSAVATAQETISRADFDRKIAAPVAEFLKRQKGINFLLLTKGVPIRIDGGDTGSRDENSQGHYFPSVDSYLAAMDYSGIPGAVKIAIHGSGARGFGWLNRYWKADEPFRHARFGGYLVTRLDGYTQADAEGLVSRAIAAEKSTTGTTADKGEVLLDVQPIFKFKETDVEVQPLAVTGEILDESDYGSWDADMVKADGLLKARHIPAELEMSEAFVGSRSNLLGYFSWGSNDPKFTDAAYHSLRFAAGAIGDTAVSTSARTFLPTTGGQSLIGDLVAQGITGVKGYVDEPLLQAIASPSIVMDRFTSGYSMAESFYAASRFVGWEDVVIGDPLLYAPEGLKARDDVKR